MFLSFMTIFLRLCVCCCLWERLGDKHVTMLALIGLPCCDNANEILTD